MYRLGGSRLVCVKAAYTFGGIGGTELSVYPPRKLGPLRFLCGEVTNGRDNFPVAIARGKGVQHVVDAREATGLSGSANRQRFRHKKPSKSPQPAHELRLLFATLACGSQTRKRKSGVGAQAQDHDGSGEEENRGCSEGGLHVEKAPQGAHQEARDEIADCIDRGESAEGHAVLLLGHEFGGERIFEGFLRANVETRQDEG